MKPASAGLIALLEGSREIAMWEELEFSLVGGQTLLFSTRDPDVSGPSEVVALPPVTPGQVPVANVGVSRSNLSSKVGVEVSEFSVSLLCGSDSVVSTLAGDVPLTRFAREGGFDGSELTLTRFFAPSPQAEACGSLSMFTGRVADVRVTTTRVELSVNASLELLNIQFPRNVYESQCLHTLYDSRCQANAALYARTATVAANSTAQSLSFTFNGPVSNGVFNLGTIEALDGLNNSAVRTCTEFVASNSSAGVANVALGFPYVPSPGDTFLVKGGCDKLYSTCDDVWGNADNFRGYEFIPTPEATY